MTAVITAGAIANHTAKPRPSPPTTDPPPERTVLASAVTSDAANAETTGLAIKSDRAASKANAAPARRADNTLATPANHTAPTTPTELIPTNLPSPTIRAGALPLGDRKRNRLNSSHILLPRIPSSA